MDFRIVSPEYWLCLLLLLSLLLKRRRPALSFSYIGLLQTERRSWRLRLRPWLLWLNRLGLFFFIVALARPQLTEVERVWLQEQTAVVFALDVSNSMIAQDLVPNRLAAAKQMILDVVAERPYTHFGLVLFAGQAYIQLPPTRDQTLFIETVNQVGLAEQMGIVDGTALGSGLATAAKLLLDLPASQRLVVLLTDGANTEATLDPVLISQAAGQLGIQIHTVALGQPGAVPFPQTNANGQTTVVYWESPLNEAVLQEIADSSQGLYGRAIEGEPMRQITDSLMDLSAVTTAAPPTNQVHELYPWFIALGFLLLLADNGLRQTYLRQLPEPV